MFLPHQVRPAAEDQSSALGVRQRAACQRPLPHVCRGGECDITSCWRNLWWWVRRKHVRDYWSFCVCVCVCVCGAFRCSGSVSIRSLWPPSCALWVEVKVWTSLRTWSLQRVFTSRWGVTPQNTWSISTCTPLHLPDSCSYFTNFSFLCKTTSLTLIMWLWHHHYLIRWGVWRITVSSRSMMGRWSCWRRTVRWDRKLLLLLLSDLITHASDGM